MREAFFPILAYHRYKIFTEVAVLAYFSAYGENEISVPPLMQMDLFHGELFANHCLRHASPHRKRSIVIIQVPETCKESSVSLLLPIYKMGNKGWGGWVSSDLSEEIP